MCQYSICSLTSIKLHFSSTGSEHKDPLQVASPSSICQPLLTHYASFCTQVSCPSAPHHLLPSQPRQPWSVMGPQRQLVQGPTQGRGTLRSATLMPALTIRGCLYPRLTCQPSFLLSALEGLVMFDPSFTWQHFSYLRILCPHASLLLTHSNHCQVLFSWLNIPKGLQLFICDLKSSPLPVLPAVF